MSELSQRERSLLLARLAEHAERYDEMVTFMHEVVESTDELNLEERNLLSLAYKNVIGTRRASWRLVVTLLNELQEKVENAKVQTDSAPEKVPEGTTEGIAQAQHDIQIVEPLKRKIEGELTEISSSVLDLLTTKLIPKAQDVEVKVFYYKMVGDYYRYLSEFSERDEKKKSASGAYDNYLEATEIARTHLWPAHPLRLGLALNFSVFYYEVLGSADRACLLAKQAFDDAIPELDSLPDELYHDSKLIMKLLRDNLTFWQSESSVVQPGEQQQSGEQPGEQQQQQQAEQAQQE